MKTRIVAVIAATLLIRQVTGVKTPQSSTTNGKNKIPQTEPPKMVPPNTSVGPVPATGPLTKLNGQGSGSEVSSTSKPLKSDGTPYEGPCPIAVVPGHPMTTITPMPSRTQTTFTPISNLPSAPATEHNSLTLALQTLHFIPAMSFAVLESNPDDWHNVNALSGEIFQQIQVPVYASSKGRGMKTSFLKDLHQKFANPGEKATRFVSHFFYHLNQLLTVDTNVPNYTQGEYSIIGSQALSPADAANLVTTDTTTMNEALARSGIRYNCLPPVLFFTIERQSNEVFEIPENLDMLNFQAPEPTIKNAPHGNECRRLASANYTLQAVMLNNNQVVGRVGESFVHADDMKSHGHSQKAIKDTINSKAILVMFVNNQESSSINYPPNLTRKAISPATLTRLNIQLELHGEGVPVQEIPKPEPVDHKPSSRRSSSHSTRSDYKYLNFNDFTTPTKPPTTPNPIVPVEPVKISPNPKSVVGSNASRTFANLALIVVSISLALI